MGFIGDWNGKLDSHEMGILLVIYYSWILIKKKCGIAMLDYRSVMVKSSLANGQLMLMGNIEPEAVLIVIR